MYINCLCYELSCECVSWALISTSIKRFLTLTCWLLCPFVFCCSFLLWSMFSWIIVGLLFLLRHLFLLTFPLLLILLNLFFLFSPLPHQPHSSFSSSPFFSYLPTSPTTLLPLFSSFSSLILFSPLTSSALFCYLSPSSPPSVVRSFLGMAAHIEIIRPILLKVIVIIETWTYSATISIKKCEQHVIKSSTRFNHFCYFFTLIDLWTFPTLARNRHCIASFCPRWRHSP